ncbi:MAG: YqjF family protein [Saprospiraceae bacterium]
MNKTFLTAAWRKLLMANYIVPPELLKPYVPWGTELDLWQGRCYVSLVGFMFLRAKMLGIPVPFHRDFEEVNLRFYVRRKAGNERRRGVAFVKEIVPKPAIALVANAVYRENYVTQRMRHSWELGAEQQKVSYEWKPFFGGEWCKLAAVTEPIAQPTAEGSEEEFITEHYWGYSRADERSTNEYRVEHPRWEVYKVLSHKIRGDFRRMYGAAFGEILAAPPASVLLAEGSEVVVLGKSKL